MHWCSTLNTCLVQVTPATTNTHAHVRLCNSPAFLCHGSYCKLSEKLGNFVQIDGKPKILSWTESQKWPVPLIIYHVVYRFSKIDKPVVMNSRSLLHIDKSMLGTDTKERTRSGTDTRVRQKKNVSTPISEIHKKNQATRASSKTTRLFLTE